jgi:hypothetical protein
MTQPLEALERNLLHQGPDLIHQSLCGDPAKCVERVRRIVLMTASLGTDARRFIIASTPWSVFYLLYPNDAVKILEDAIKGVLDEDMI